MCCLVLHGTEEEAPLPEHEQVQEKPPPVDEEPHRETEEPNSETEEDPKPIGTSSVFQIHRYQEKSRQVSIGSQANQSKELTFEIGDVSVRCKLCSVTIPPREK